ncbi:MAG: ester cyclase [Omnitrophica WOR_2 bacterium]
MSEQENIKIVRQLFDDLNSHDLDAGDRLMSNNVMTETPGSQGPMDKARNRLYEKQFIDAFPDLHFDVRDVIAQGDKVSVTWRVKGTHKGPLLSPKGDTLPATNKKIDLPGCTIYQISRDKVVHQEIYWDMVTLLTQLGVPVELSQMSRSQR